MTSAELLKWLDLCIPIEDTGGSCGDCPYADECTETSSVAVQDKWLEDVRAYLKAQEVVKMSGWISVKDRLPAETHSIFYPWFGKKEWNKAMWREQSDKVLVTVAFKDGTRIVTTGETHDGIWHTSISRILEPVVTHWLPLPEPQKEDADADKG